MSGSILVVGSSNTDMIVKTSRIPRPGETVIGGEFSTAAGGKGANQAVAAARAGGRVTFLARVGTDMFGDRAVEGFGRDGIDTGLVIRDSGARSGVALIFVDEGGENSIAVASGANARLSADDVSAAAEAIAAADMLLMQLEVPVDTVRAAAAIARDNGVPVILNPAPAAPLDDDLLSCVTVLTPNESEAELLTGIPMADGDGARRAAEELHRRGVETVLVTLGKRGVFVRTDDYSEIVPAFAVEPVDTTAAGDVFNGVLAVSLAEGMELVSAVRYACAAAALSVTTLGAQTSSPGRAMIDAFLAERET